MLNHGVAIHNSFANNIIHEIYMLPERSLILGVENNRIITTHFYRDIKSITSNPIVKFLEKLEN